MATVKERTHRKQIQWLLAPLAPLVVVGGYYYPLLGYIGLALMTLMLLLAPLRGRMYCGWICAMGSFHERVLAKVSLNKNMPPLFKKAWFRWLIFILMMGLMTFRLIMSGGDSVLVGGVFVMMWTIATSMAVALGLFYKPRSWCNFCPMATMQALLSPRTYLLRVSEDCKQCGHCLKACPVETYPGSYKERGTVPSRECMRCENCLVNCPRGALSLPRLSEEARQSRPAQSSPAARH